MRPLLRPPHAATPTAHPTDPTQPIAHDRPLDPGSAVRQSVPPAGHSALFCPSGVVLLSVVFVDLPWEATPPHFYSVPGTRPFHDPHLAYRSWIRIPTPTGTHPTAPSLPFLAPPTPPSRLT